MLPDWVYKDEDFDNTPSIKDGYTRKLEEKLRREGVKTLLQVGNLVKFRNVTLTTAAIFFHRFYMYHSFKDFEGDHVALGALFLAGKVEDTPKRICHLVADAMKLELFRFCDANSLTAKVLAVERVMLSALRFDFVVENPCVYLKNYITNLRLPGGLENDAAKMASAFLNDCRFLTLLVEWEPQILAIAMISLAFAYKNYEPDNLLWYYDYVVGLTPEVLVGIGQKIRDFYDEVTPRKEDSEVSPI